MYCNRMHQLAQLVPDPAIIGSKLKNDPLSDLITEPNQESIYVQADERVKKIQEVTMVLEKNGREYFKSTRPDKQKTINEIINRKIAEGNTLMNQLKPLLKQIDEEYKAESSAGDNSHMVEWKTVKNSAADAFTAFREAQEKISEEIRETIHRQANLVQGKDISAEELENLVLHPQKGQDMLKEKLLDSPSVQLQNCVSDIIDKCNDVLKLQKSMRECLSMMEELGMLVHLQGQKLLLIEEVIGGASDHIQRGKDNLQKGKESHKKAKKKMCCVMMLMLAIVGVIVIPIVITQLK